MGPTYSQPFDMKKKEKAFRDKAGVKERTKVKVDASFFLYFYFLKHFMFVRKSDKLKMSNQNFIESYFSGTPPLPLSPALRK